VNTSLKASRRRCAGMTEYVIVIVAYPTNLEKRNPGPD
jgi:hypothetical protein